MWALVRLSRIDSMATSNGSIYVGGPDGLRTLVVSNGTGSIHDVLLGGRSFAWLQGRGENLYGVRDGTGVFVVGRSVSSTSVFLRPVEAFATDGEVYYWVELTPEGRWQLQFRSNRTYKGGLVTLEEGPVSGLLVDEAAVYWAQGGGGEGRLIRAPRTVME